MVIRGEGVDGQLAEEVVQSDISLRYIENDFISSLHCAVSDYMVTGQ